MFNQSTRQMLAKMGVGLRVDHDAVALTNATVTHFTVTGRIQLTGLYGIVTVAAGAACTCTWAANPTVGTTTALCTGLDIDPALVGDLLGISGVLGTAMTYGGAVVGFMQPVVVTAGAIQFIASAAEGSISTHLYYLPLTADGAVVAA